MQPAPTTTSSIKVAPAPPVAQHDQPAERSDSEAAVPQPKDAGQVDEERSGDPVRILYLVEWRRCANYSSRPLCAGSRPWRVTRQDASFS